MEHFFQHFLDSWTIYPSLHGSEAMGINAWFTDSRISSMAIMLVVLQLGFNEKMQVKWWVYRVLTKTWWWSAIHRTTHEKLTDVFHASFSKNFRFGHMGEEFPSAQVQVRVNYNSRNCMFFPSSTATWKAAIMLAARLVQVSLHQSAGFSLWSLA